MRSEPRSSSAGVSSVETDLTRAPSARAVESRPELRVETVEEPRPGVQPVAPEAAPTPFDAASFDWSAALPAQADSFWWTFRRGVKTVFDRAAALGGILLLSPLLVTVAVLVKLTSRGPIFYTCEYVGFRGRRFRGYKFRTMVENAEELKAKLEHLNHMKGPAFKIRKDPRITSIGGFLRKYSIDELPQLWNVVRGDMSLVGPRPPLPEEWAEFADWQRGKLSVTPGITCYWQVRGRSEITDFDTWAKMDLQYIQEWSLRTDLRVLMETIPAVVRGHGAY